ncbi:hypothetical protein UB46_23505 [Burkholderiaceae bacterium 16]|nr:hypothetical protein UB46_23505 [Burkholderiaceae bacterium 16]
MDDNEKFLKELADLLGPEAAEQIAEIGAEIRSTIDLSNARRIANGEPTLEEEADEAMRDAGLDDDPEFSTQ